MPIGYLTTTRENLLFPHFSICLQVKIIGTGIIQLKVKLLIKLFSNDRLTSSGAFKMTMSVSVYDLATPTAFITSLKSEGKNVTTP